MCTQNKCECRTVKKDRMLIKANLGSGLVFFCFVVCDLSKLKVEKEVTEKHMVSGSSA